MSKRTNYDVVIKFRASKEIKKLLKAKSKASNISDSEYLRQAILKESIKENKNILAALNNLTYEVNKIGTNVNQIVKNNNSHFYSEYEKKKLFAEMGDIQKGFAQVLEVIMENLV